MAGGVMRVFPLGTTVMKALVPAAAVVFLALPQAALAQSKGYAIEWRQVGGGWRSGYYHTPLPQCVHGSEKAFCIEDFRGKYKQGEITTFWVNGCERPPIKIQCTVLPLN